MCPAEQEVTPLRSAMVFLRVRKLVVAGLLVEVRVRVAARRPCSRLAARPGNGLRLVAGAVGVREATVFLGVDELESGAEPLGRRGGPAEGASGPPIWIPGCARRCWCWSSRTSAAIRCRRCGGRARGACLMICVRRCR